jgi:hypothetical protein
MATGTIRYRSHGKKYWENYDPVLGKNEFGIVEPSNKFKIGNGFSKFSELRFIGSGGSSGPSTLPNRLGAGLEVDKDPENFDFDAILDQGFYPYMNAVMNSQGVLDRVDSVNGPALLDERIFFGGLLVIAGVYTVSPGVSGVLGSQLLVGTLLDTESSTSRNAIFSRGLFIEGSGPWTEVGSTIV